MCLRMVIGSGEPLAVGADGEAMDRRYSGRRCRRQLNPAVIVPIRHLHILFRALPLHRISQSISPRHMMVKAPQNARHAILAAQVDDEHVRPQRGAEHQLRRVGGEHKRLRARRAVRRGKMPRERSSEVAHPTRGDGALLALLQPEELGLVEV